MKGLRQSHWQAVKRNLRYINGTCSDGIFCSYANDVELVCYIDSDWVEILGKGKVLQVMQFT